MDVVLLLMVLGVMLSGFWAADALDHIRKGDHSPRGKKTWLVVVIIKLCYTVGKAGDLHESEQPTHRTYSGMSVIFSLQCKDRADGGNNWQRLSAALLLRCMSKHRMPTG